MIREIIQNTKSPRLLYQNKLVCGCVYRSFNDLEAGIFFRFAINNGRLSRQQLFDLIDKSAFSQNEERFMSIIDTFRKLQIVKTADYNNFELNPEFIHRVQQFIKDQKVLEPVNLQNDYYDYIQVQRQRTSAQLPLINQPNTYQTPAEPTHRHLQQTTKQQHKPTQQPPNTDCSPPPIAFLQTIKCDLLDFRSV